MTWSQLPYRQGEQSRDVTYIDNVVEANFAALSAQDAPGKIFNVGYGKQTTLNEIIEFLEKIVGLQTCVKYHPARLGDVRHSFADITLARSILAYEPKVGVQEGLKKTVEALKGK